MFLWAASQLETNCLRKVLVFVFALLLVAALNGCTNRDEGKAAPANLTPADAATSNALHSNHPVQTTLEKDYPFKGAGVLRLTFPRTWVDAPRKIMKGNEPVNVIEFVPFSGADFEVIVEVRNLGDFLTRAFDIRASLVKVGNTELPNCVEQSLDIYDFKGPDVIGSYYTVTDKRWVSVQPQPGEYKYLTQGYAKLAGMVLKLRVLSNQAPGEEKNNALEMIRSARFTRR